MLTSYQSAGRRDSTKPLRLALLSALLWISACALFQPWQETYLEQAQDHAIKDDVQRRLGAPRFVQLLAAGGTVWVYRIWSYDGGDLNGPGGSWCDQYQLVFDQRAVLRHWVKETC